MKQRIYLAGSCSSDQRTFMRKIAEYLRSQNYEVYCPFELKIPNAWDLSQEDWSHKVFDADIAAIDKCDIFLMMSPGRQSTAGTNFEQGYAYAKGKRVLVLQYQPQKTSLMTYCGCDVFLNASNSNIEDDINTLLLRCESTACKTILT